MVLLQLSLLAICLTLSNNGCMDVNTPVIVDFQRSVNFKSAYKIVFIQNLFASCVKYLKYPFQVLVFQAQLDTDTLFLKIGRFS